MLIKIILTTHKRALCTFLYLVSFLLKMDCFPHQADSDRADAYNNR